MWKYTHTDELYHYGVPGMKWGHHKARLKEYDRRYEQGVNHILSNTSNMNSANRKISSFEKSLNKEYQDSIDFKQKRDKRIKTAKIIGGAAVVASGAYIVNKYMKKNNIKITTEKKIKGQQWLEESKRLDDLMKTSTKNIESFMAERNTKTALDQLSTIKRTSKAEAELRKKMYETVFR